MAKLRFVSLITLGGALAFGPILAAEPILLWMSAAVGMTQAEVRTRVPNAVANDRPGKSTAGWMSLLTERDRTGGRDQKVEFQFQDDRLIGVTVAEGERFGLAPIDQGDVRTVVARMHETYGAPVRCRGLDGGGRSCFWIKDGKTVAYMGQEQTGPYVLTFLHKEMPGDRDLLK